jgi:hypothetical protein
MIEQKRSSTRLQTVNVLKVTPFDSSETEKIKVCKDIGEGGCYFQSDKSYGVGKLLRIKLKVNRKTLHLTCRVVWEAPREKGGHDVGVKFLIISREEADELERLVSVMNPVSEVI